MDENTSKTRNSVTNVSTNSVRCFFHYETRPNIEDYIYLNTYSFISFFVMF